MIEFISIITEDATSKPSRHPTRGGASFLCGVDMYICRGCEKIYSFPLINFTGLPSQVSPQPLAILAAAS
ncbi:MAG TPA: hypothetical protein EYG40_08645 [Verrucomicrobia bacterium]|nr:hypothetical protein [Verrucomicrobiota bacterium]